MKNISFIIPCEVERIPLLLDSIDAYKTFGITNDIEFIIVSRTIKPKQLPFKHKLINYKWTLTPEYFNPSLALNLGVRDSKYDNIIITSPEIKPYTNCLKQLRRLKRGNYVCQVFDLHKDGTRKLSLVNRDFRFTHPGFYFLALYKKEDIETINGWDLNFMYGWAWDDNDFGERFVRAGLPFKIIDEIQAEHQYHPRIENWETNWTSTHLGYCQNKERLDKHNANNTTTIKPGLGEVEEWYKNKIKEMELQDEN